MSDTNIKLKRSSVPGKVPTTGQLDFGEIAVNTADGLLFLKSQDSAGAPQLIRTLEDVTSGNGVVDSSALPSLHVANDTHGDLPLGSRTSGNYIATGGVTGNGLSGTASGEGSTFTVNSNATAANDANTIVYRDASGNFTAGTITAALNGNANTTSALQSPIIITLSGQASGTSGSVDLSGNVNIPVTVDSAGSATTTAQVNLAPADSATFIVLAPEATGNQELTTDTTFTYNALTQTLNVQNLNVTGSSVQLSNSVAINDNIITLNADETGTPSENGGIEIERGTSANKSFIWDETADKWTLASETLVAGRFEGNLNASFIDGAAGSLDSSVIPSLDIANDTHGEIALGTRTTGNYVATGATGNGLTGSVASEGGTFTVTLGTPSTLSAATTNNVTASSHTHAIDESGFVLTASQTTSGVFDSARLPSLDIDTDTHGDLPYSRLSGTPTIGDGTLTLNTSGAGLSGSATFSANQTGGATFTVTSNATSVNTGGTIVARNPSGNFSAGTITAALSGNASTATALQTGRTISLTGDVTGTSAAFDGTGDVSITATVANNSHTHIASNITSGVFDSARIPTLDLDADTQGTIDFASRTTGDVALGTRTSGNYVQQGATGNGLTGSVNSEGGTFTVTMGTPSTLTASTTNATTASSHTHEIDESGFVFDASQTTTGVFDSARLPPINSANVAAKVTLADTNDASSYLVLSGNPTGDEALGTDTTLNYDASTQTLNVQNLNVNGTTTTINTETLTIDDNIIVLNNNEAGTPSQNAGIEIERGTSANKTFLWDEGADRWTIGSEELELGSISSTATISINQPLNVTASVGSNIYAIGLNRSSGTGGPDIWQQGGEGVVIGAASTTGILSILPDGIEVNGGIAADNETAPTSGMLVGNEVDYLARNVAGSANIGIARVNASNQIVINNSGTNSTIINSSSGGSGGVFFQTGATTRAWVDNTGGFNISGQAVNFNASGVRASIDKRTSDDVIRIGSVSGGDALTGTQGEVSLIVKGTEAVRLKADQSAQFADSVSATGGFTGDLTGNASTATALATGRTISLTGDVTGTSAAFDGTGNVSITATVGNDTHTHNANNLTGTTLAPTVVNSSLTSVGTLTDLDVVTTGAIIIDVQGNDFQVVDTTNTGFTNFIWRDHSAGKLYLGTNVDDEVEIRSNLSLQSNSSIVHDGTTILTSALALQNIASANITGDVVAGTGISMGSATAGSATDVSRHVSLYGTTYGFSVTPSTLNVVAGGVNTLSSTATTITSRVNHNFSNGADVTGSLTLNAISAHTSETETLATLTESEIASFSASTYGGGKFVIIAKDGSNRHICELLVTHDGTTATATQYGTVTTNGELATYDVDISGGNVRILATSASTNSTVYNVSEELIAA